MAVQVTLPFRLERRGVVMEPQPWEPYETWGVLNPGGVRGPDGGYYLFPRLVAPGNYSRIGRARLTFAPDGVPLAVERLSLALEPREPYEVTRAGGGVEDPRVTYVAPLGLYVMAYTAYTPNHPRIALAVSRDLLAWTRLGPLRYTPLPDGHDLNLNGNKDGMVFPDVVSDPRGRPALAILHRPTFAVAYSDDGCEVMSPPGGGAYRENIWISYAPLEEVRADIQRLTQVDEHRPLLAPMAEWERIKVGGGAPPVRLPYGWLLLYHGVSRPPDQSAPPPLDMGEEPLRYNVGAAVLDLEDPTRIIYRSPRPILEPDAPYEATGLASHVVFPTATDLRADGRLDVYYGAADSRVGVASAAIPSQLPTEG